MVNKAFALIDFNYSSCRWDSEKNIRKEFVVNIYIYIYIYIYVYIYLIGNIYTANNFSSAQYQRLIISHRKQYKNT